MKDTMTDLNIGKVPIGDHDGDWFKVMSRLGGRAIRVNAASVLGYYVRQRKDEYEKILHYTARKYGISPDECFQRLLNDEDLGEPVKDFSEAPPLFSEN